MQRFIALRLVRAPKNYVVNHYIHRSHVVELLLHLDTNILPNNVGTQHKLTHIKHRSPVFII